MKIIHAADLHIDSPLRGLSRIDGADETLLRSATRRAFTGLIDRCLEEDAALLLLAGDIFDTDWRDANSGVFLLTQLARLRETATEVVLIEGNHDAGAGLLRTLRWPSHVQLLPHRKPGTVRFEPLGVAVHGQSFARRDVTDNLAAQYPAALPGLLNIGLLHTNANGSAEHDSYAPCSTDQLVQHGYDYWALGHIHTQQTLHTAPWVVYPGNLQGRHARETGPKGCAMLTVEDGVVRAVEFVPLDVVRWEQVVIDAAGLTDLDALAGAACEQFVRMQAAAEGRPAVVRVTVRGSGPLHRALADGREKATAALQLAAAGVEGVWLEKLQITTRPAAAGEDDDGLAEFGELIRGEVEALRRQDGAWAELTGELEPLRQFLGAQLPGVADAKAQWEAWLQTLIAEVPDLLQARLSNAEEERA